MVDYRKKLLIRLEEAENNYRLGEQFFNVSYKLSGESKLLLKALDSIYSSVIISIEIILHQAYVKNKIRLYKNSELNMKTFFRSGKALTGLDVGDFANFKKIIELARVHRGCGFEIGGEKKAIMLLDSGKTLEVSENELGEFLKSSWRLLASVSRNFLDKIRKV